MSRARIHRQTGQAMAEFVVMTSGFLLILFVLVPVVAKLSDMSYKAQEAARYTAWERTVWYKTNGSDEMMPSQINLKDGYLATRSDEDILNTAEKRILSFKQDPQIFLPQDIDPQVDSQANSFWRWTHGSGGGQPMTSAGSLPVNSSINDRATPSMAYTIIDGYNTVMGGVAKVLNFLSFGRGDEDFMQIAHPTRNFYTTSVNIPVPIAGSSQLGSQPLFGNRFTELNVGAQSAVLADGWVAQTADGEGSHFDEKVDDFVLGTLIDENPVFGVIQEIIGIIEPSFKTLDLAPVNTDPIDDSSPKCNITSGFCYFDE